MNVMLAKGPYFQYSGVLCRLFNLIKKAMMGIIAHKLGTLTLKPVSHN